MPLDLLSIGMGFGVGATGASIAWALMQNQVRNPEKTKLTAVWGINEVVRPTERLHLLAERVEAINVPRGARILVPEGKIGAVPPAVLQNCEVRMHPDVRMNAALGRDRALIFSGAITPKSYAVWTVEEAAVQRLQAEFKRLWQQAEPYVERIGLNDVAGKEGRHVEITGQAADLVEFRGRRMLRVSDKAVSVGVVVPNDLQASDVAGGPVRVVGTVKKDGGYTYVEARTVTRANPRLVTATTPGMN